MSEYIALDPPEPTSIFVSCAECTHWTECPCGCGWGWCALYHATGESDEDIEVPEDCCEFEPNALYDPDRHANAQADEEYDRWKDMQMELER